MPDPNPITATFPMARCEPCDRTVLTYAALDDAGLERRLCVHCDGEIADELRWVSATELEDSGYQFGAPAPKKACGCGNGGGCSIRKD